MSDFPAVEALQAQLAEQEREMACLRARLESRQAAEHEPIEERLRHSEEQARDLIRYAPTGIYEVDFRTGRFRTVNDAMCEILGYTREELFGMTAFELLDDAGRLLFADRIRRTLAGEKVDTSVEYRVKKKDGSVIYGVLSTRITYQNGQPDGAFVIAHDVTERRRTADALREQGERLARLAAEQEAVLAAIADGLVVYDGEGRVVHLNAAAQQMLGYSTEQGVSRIHDRWALLNPLRPDGSPYDLDEMPVARALRGEVVTGHEVILHVPARAGKPLRVAVSAAPICSPEGAVAGAVTTFTDVEAFYRMSEELRQANKQLEAQAAELQKAATELERRVAERTAALTSANQELSQREAMLRYQATVLANISDAVVATDEHGLITYLNPAAEEQCGWSVQEAIGRNPVDLFQAKFAGSTRAGLAQQVLAGDRWRGEAVIHRKDGTPFYADVTAVVRRDDSGRLLGYIAVQRDITERKRLEEALRAGQEQAQAYSRLLVAAVENEQRSLARELHDQAGQSLSALKLSLAHLRREADNTGAHTARLEEMGQLLDTVMDDLHRLAINLRPVSLDRYGLLPALQQYLDFYRRQSGLDADLVAVGIEEQRLPADVETAIYRMVQEALTNVVRHAQAKRVSVMLERRQQRLIAIVEDDGRGFDVDEAMRCGRLGLLGMRERAGILAGTLTIESEPGQGTAVYIDVPIPGA